MVMITLYSNYYHYFRIGTTKKYEAEWPKMTTLKEKTHDATKNQQTDTPISSIFGWIVGLPLSVYKFEID